jgi:hypothetical protein
MVVGWLCLSAAIITVMISFGQGPSSWEGELAENPHASADLTLRVAQGYARQLQLRIAAGGFFSVFLVFWGVSYIVCAISFLPGKQA